MVINYEKSILKPMYCFTSTSDNVHEFGEITQNKGHYAVQGHSRSPILVPIESSYASSY